MGTAPVFASASQALDVARAALGYLAAADATELTVAEQAGCLQGLEKLNSAAVAARTSILGAFTADQGYAEDGDYSPRSWLMHRTGITHGAAVSHTAWMKWAAAHPAVHAALTAEQISESYARVICAWTSKLPEDARPAADEILLGAAGSGLELADLAGLAGEMYERSRQDRPDTDPGDDDGEPGASGADGDGEPDGDGDGDGEPDARGRRPGSGQDDRGVRLATTIGGAGWIRGDLTPECAEFVRTVLDSLSAPAGADDDRSHEQRYHDALQEAMRRLIAAGLVPERAGHAVNVLAHLSLADLMLLEGSSALLEQWTSGLRARWAAHRAAAGAAGGQQGLWPDGDAAQALACDASVTPVVVGDVNMAAFGDLVRLCTELGRFGHGAGAGGPVTADPVTADPVTADPVTTAPRMRPLAPPRMCRPLVRPRMRAPLARPGPGTPWSRPSSARRSSCCPGRAAWPGSCAASSSTRGWPDPACRSTSATARPSPPTSARPSGYGPGGTASGPADAASPPGRVRCTTPPTRPTAARPASPAARCCVFSTTR